ncbi:MULTISPECIES: hypothetical protein [unclassified Microcoleus]|uniref:hypothetical protein n=1 Tax=unclassified Microcoleus TaxID=2642155 RepID=UPI002FD6A520
MSLPHSPVSLPQLKVERDGEIGGEDRPNSESAASEQEVVRIAVVSSRKTVLETIHTFYRPCFAAVSDWNPPQRGAKPGQFVSVPIGRSRKA